VYEHKLESLGSRVAEGRAKVWDQKEADAHIPMLASRGQVLHCIAVSH
jgi:hypothetical protein